MRLFLTLFACSLFAIDPIVEVRFIGYALDLDEDARNGQLLVDLIQPSLGEECYLTIEVSKERGERLTFYIEGEPSKADVFLKQFLHELNTFTHENQQLCAWLKDLRAETIPAIEYFTSDREQWEEIHGSNPLNREEALAYLEKLGYTDADFQPYHTLYTRTITQEEQDHISYIITSLANDNFLTLGFKATELRDRGKKIDHIHPLIFLGYIVTTPELLEALPKVAQRKYTWGLWTDGFITNIRLYAERDELSAYFPGFCHHTGASPIAISHLLKIENYEGLLRFFF